MMRKYLLLMSATLAESIKVIASILFESELNRRSHRAPSQQLPKRAKLSRANRFRPNGPCEHVLPEKNGRRSALGTRSEQQPHIFLAKRHIALRGSCF